MALTEAAVGLGLGIAGLASGAFNTGYNIWSNQRDFDYQKDLQKKIFEREDNAVQRRVADLKAAGLNPNLAAGSAAGAGSVVGRSTTPGLNGNPIGTALDMATHVQQLRNLREENAILKNQKAISYNDFLTSSANSTLDVVNAMKLLGMNPSVHMKDGQISTRVEDGIFNQVDSPLGNMLKWQLQNDKNSADLLQRDVDWYTADKIQSYINTAGSLFSHGAGGYNSIMSGNRFNRSRR